MAWTPPLTWVNGNVPSDTDLNEQIRDNSFFNFNGKAANAIVRDNNGRYTTTSTSFVPVDSTNLSITLTLTTGRILMIFNACSNNVSGVGSMDFLIDGARYMAAGADGFGINNVNGSNVCLTAMKLGLSAGSHTFQPCWRAYGTTYTLEAGNGVAQQDSLIQFAVMEF